MITREEVAISLYKLTKYVLEEDSILTIVLKGQLLIENHVESLLNIVLVEPSVFDYSRMYLPQKLDILVAIGVFSKNDTTAYRKFNHIRSKFAHNIDYELTNEDIKSILDAFSPKHLVLFEKSGFEKETNTIERLKLIILPLLLLVIIQSAIDDVEGKPQIQPIDIVELERIKSKANRK